MVQYQNNSAEMFLKWPFTKIAKMAPHSLNQMAAKAKNRRKNFNRHLSS